MSRREKHARSAGKQTKGKKVLWIIGWIITLIQIAATAGLVYLLHMADIIPDKYLLIIAEILFALVVICRLFMMKRIKVGRFVVGAVIALLIAALLAVVDYDLYKLTHTLQTITDSSTETTKVSVYVLEEDPAQSIEDAADYTFGILETLARDDSDHAVSLINEELGKEITTAEYTDSSALADALLSGDCQAIILNEGFVNLIEDSEEHASFSEQIRELAAYEWETEITVTRKQTTGTSSQQSQAEEENVEDNVFTMFISGIDVAGAISTKSRSDVNILCVVNPNTHQILLVSTPRDYYVPLSISNGVKDKLTHAGIYGVNVSMDTLSMLYDTNVDYYFRINFTGFKNVIDALGGVTVHSDYTFSAGGYDFVAGDNYVDGDAALAFARERYSFAEGDRQRGRDQMEVIKGAIAKMMSPSILNNFTGLMESLEGSFETSLPYDTMTELVKEQLAGGGSWNVTTYSVDGTGASSTTYSMPGSYAYVMNPDEATVSKAQELIDTVKTGGIPQITE